MTEYDGMTEHELLTIIRDTWIQYDLKSAIETAPPDDDYVAAHIIDCAVYANPAADELTDLGRAVYKAGTAAQTATANVGSMNAEAVKRDIEAIREMFGEDTQGYIARLEHDLMLFAHSGETIKHRYQDMSQQLAAVTAERDALRAALDALLMKTWLLLNNHAQFVNHNFPGGFRLATLPDEEETLELRLEVIDAANAAKTVLDEDDKRAADVLKA